MYSFQESKKFFGFIPLKKSLLISAALFGSLAVSGCQTSMLGHNKQLAGNPAGEITGSIGPASQHIADVTMSAKKWQADRKNSQTASHYAKSLAAIGSHDKAFQVYEEAVRYNPTNRALMSEYGKALSSHGQPAKAQSVLQKAIAMGGPDASLYSAQGIVLDKVGNHKLAQQYYNSALALKPGSSALLNNLGMSYMLSGDLKNAEGTFREAMAQKGASDKIRQNLILVVGLQGRFEDAKQISGNNQTPSTLDANMVYLREMISQPNSWKDLKKIDKKKT